MAMDKAAARPPTAVAPARPARRTLRWLGLGVLALLLALLLALTGSAWLAWRHPAALPWLLARVPGLQVADVRGSLASGSVHIGTLDWQLPAGAGRLQLWQLQIDGASLTLWPRPGSQAAVRLATVQAERAAYTSPPPSDKPLAAPASLHLPFDMAVAKLAVGTLQIDQLPPVQGLSASLTLGADNGRLHRIDGLVLQLNAGSAAIPMPVHAQGSLQIGTAGALPVQATVALQRRNAPAWQASLQASGPLATLQVQASLQGDAARGNPAPSLQADATVLPFAPWPLGQTTLRTQALDLSALLPQLPQTRLAGSATLQTQGLAQVAAIDATLDNSLPGAWDTGRLPLRRLHLQASGRPDQTDRLQLDRFDLQLGDATGAAGRITGQGRWQADTLALQLQIDQLLPARLHRNAAPLRLAGPLSVRVTGLPIRQTSTTNPATNPASSPTGNPAATPSLALDGTLSGQWADGSGLPVQLRLVAEGSTRQVSIAQAEARAGGALARLAGQAKAVADGWQLQGTLKLADFDPRPWWRGPDGSAWRRGPHRLQAEAQGNLLWRPALATSAGELAIDRLLAALDGEASLTVHDSVLAGVPLSATAGLQSQGPSATLQADVTLAGNQASLQGNGGAAAAADRWTATLKAPNLATLAPLRQLLTELLPANAATLQNLWPAAGNAQASVSTQGRWPALQSQGELQATGLIIGLGQLNSGTLRWRQGDRSDAPLQLQLQAQGLRVGSQQLDALSLGLDGSLAEHRVRLSADSPLRPPAWSESLLGPAGSGTRLQGDARGQWLPAAAGGRGLSTLAGQYRLLGLNLNGGARDPQGGSRPWLAAKDLSGSLALDATGAVQTMDLAPGRMQLPGTALNWRSVGWQPGSNSLVVDATLETIDVAALLNTLQPEVGWRGDLTLGGRIDIRSSGSALAAEIVLARGGGDLSVVDDLNQAQAMGLSDMRLALAVQDGQWRLAQALVGRRVGTLVGAQTLTVAPGQRWPSASAALQGLLQANVSNLGVWGSWVPPGWRLSGAIDTVVQLDGTLGAPRISGNLRGSNLGLRNVLEGVSLNDGVLDVVLTGDNARIERGSFQGGDGKLSVTGGLTLGTQPRLALQLQAERFRLLGRVDRQVVASGNGSISLAGRRLQVDGKFSVDEGLIDIGRGDAPKLDDDVSVVRRGTAATRAAAPDSADATTRPSAAAAPPLQVQMQVAVNLGQKLRLRGQGVDTLLRGDLMLTSPNNQLALNGTVTTQDGRYAAYGQNLEITRGRFIFSGEVDNPRLDVLAVRPNLDVLVGVLIDGNGHNPRVRLYSEPELADYDKLSWLVLGRAPDGLGSADTALLQRAAFALLAGSSGASPDGLVQSLGLSDFSLRQADGDTRDTIISLGKQLSRRWYVGYERGVHATTGTWQLIYRVAQRFTLRAQSGGENAVDLIWTWRW